MNETTQELGLRAAEGVRELAAVLGLEVEIVHGARDVEIAVGVEAIDEGRALVAQVALDLEIGVERERAGLAVLQVAAELVLQRLFRKVGDVGGHARHREAVLRHDAVRVVAAAAPVGIGHHGLPADLVEGDVLGRMAGRRRDRDGGEDAILVARRPLEHLHAAHRAAEDREQLGDAEMIQQADLCAAPCRRW